MQKFLIVLTLVLVGTVITAQPYYRCRTSTKYHLYKDCDGLDGCSVTPTTLKSCEVKSKGLEICKICNVNLRDLKDKILVDENTTCPTKRNSKEYYWLNYLLLGILTGLFKVGRRWEAIGAAIGLGVFLYFMNRYFHSHTFKLSYGITQSSLYFFGFALSQTLIIQIYKNRKSDSFISSMMNALSKSEKELHASKKKNDTLEQQIRNLNLTQKQTEEALRQSQQIIAQLKELNPETGSAYVIVENEKHRRYLIDALKKADNRIVITSGWIRNSVITEEFKSLFKACLDRKVDIFIYYGFVYGNRHNDSDREALDFFERMNAQYTNFVFRNHLTNDQSGITGNHSKILIQDDRFVVLGSFNWLSNSGKLKKNLEMSMATNDSKTIREILSKLGSN
jgi:hypothetical protein